MNPEQHQRVMQILGEAIEREPESRAAWIETVCAGDEALRAEVTRLLSRQKPAAQFLEESPLIAAAESNGRSMIGQRIGLYKIISEIGRGGMGAVYLAERDDQEFAKRVAIKLIKRGMDTDFVVQRFRNERQILANLDHPNIARLLDGGTTESALPYFIMEYVEGETIVKYASANNLSMTERLELFRIVCSTVQYAHQNLVIHRDLKPSNILVAHDGEPKLLDFGIAKLLQDETGDETELTATAIRVMTPEYASPEQVKGERVTTATDVYSLGVLLYELLTGCRPYRVKSRQPEELAKAICQQEPTKPSLAVTRRGDEGVRPEESNWQSAFVNRQLKGDLDNIILKALRKEPQRRYVSVEQFSEDIRRHLEGLPVSARKDTLSYRTSKFVQRNKIAVAAAALILLVLLGGITATAWEARRARAESARAEQRFMQVRTLAHSVLFDYHDAIASLPGSTPVRERLVKDALKYLDDLADDPGNSPTLQRELATAYLRVGDVQGRPYASNLGHADDALASYHKALKILETMSAKSNADGDLKQGLATIYERLGNIQLRKGNFNEAFDRNSQALTMRTELVAANPNNKSYRREMADSLLYVGDALQVKCPEPTCQQEALADQQRALQLRQGFAAENPLDTDAKRGVAQAHLRIGYRLSTLSDITKEPDYVRQWLEHDRAALAITRELVAANSTNAIDRRNLADELMATANAQLENKDTAGALSGYNESLEIFKALAAADASNSEAQRDLSFVYLRLGALSAQTGKVASAREHYGHGLEITQQLLAQDPSDEEGLAIAAGVYTWLSTLARDSGDLETAIENCKREIEMRGRVVAVERNTSVHWSVLAVSYQMLGLLYAQKGGARVNYKRIDVTTKRIDVTAPKVITAKQAAQWREAKNYFGKALQVFEDLKSKGELGATYAAFPDLMRDYVAICDLFLARLFRG